MFSITQFRLPTYLWVLCAFCSPFPAHAGTTLTLGDASGLAGESKVVPVFITSDQGALAAQFDIYFDESKMSLGAMDLGSALQDHSMDIDELAAGIMRVTILSNTNAAFLEGSLLEMQVKLVQDVAQGETPIALQNVLLVDNQVNLLDFTELTPVGTPEIGEIGATVLGNAVTFQVSVNQGSQIGYLWDFGDGTSSTEATVTHTYGHAGSYMVTVAVSNLISTATASANVTVGKAGAVVVVSNLEQSADGFPKTVTVTTDPPGLPYSVTYNGEVQAPTQPGTYRVDVTVEGDDYEGMETTVLFVKSWLDSISEETEDLGGGWRRLDWFGIMMGSRGSWAYHTDFGWIFTHSATSDDLWMYWPEGDWIWTGREVYPWLYRSPSESSEGTWLYYFEGTRNPNHLFDYGLDEWTERNY